MPSVKITRPIVTAAAPRSATYAIWDSLVPGFGLRVFPSGKKSWILYYRPYPGGARTPKRTAFIGSVEELSPDQARKQADDLRAQIKTGVDPHASKIAARQGITVAELADEFMSRRIIPKRGANTAAAYKDIFERIVKPKFGKRRAEDLSGRELSALHSEIGEGRMLRSGEEVPGRPSQANKVLAVVSSMYGWANGPVALVPENMNPARRIERFEEKVRGDVLSAAQLERLGVALRKAETEGLPWRLDPDAKAKHRRKDADEQRAKIDPYAAAAIRLLIFTGMRLREVLHLRWSEVNFERGMIMLTRHKTSRTTGVKSIILNDASLTVLKSIPRLGVYVIAGARAGQSDEKPRADLKRPWAMVRVAAALPELPLHGLRHNFGGFGAGGGFGLPVVGRLLGHSQPATTARYSHFDSDPLRRASNAIATSIEQAMEGRPSNSD